MNKSQRAEAGIYGAIENTLDDLRHTWEKLWFGNEITGDVNMFTTNTVPSYSADDLYSNAYRSSYEQSEGQDIESPDIER